jgi:hypothetical protein
MAVKAVGMDLSGCGQILVNTAGPPKVWEHLDPLRNYQLLKQDATLMQDE